MQFKLNNIMCFESLNAEIKPGVNVVVGPNSAGKTSFATCLAAVSSGNPDPLGLGRSSDLYMWDGRDKGAVIKSGATLKDGDTSWTWGPGLGSIIADAPFISNMHAVGLEEMLQPGRGKLDRIALWAKLVNVSDYKSLLTSDVYAQIGHVPEMTHESVLKMLEDFGWDESELMMKKQVSELKKEWQITTGTSYTKATSVKWTPPSYNEVDIIDAVQNVHTVDKRIKDAAQIAESAAAHTAVTEAEIEAGKAAENKLAIVEASLADSNQEIDALNKEFGQAETVLASVSVPTNKLRGEIEELNDKLKVSEPSHTCPQCGTGLTLDANGAMKHFKGLSPVEREAINKNIGAKNAELINLESTLDAAQKKLQNIQALLEQKKSQSGELRGEINILTESAKKANLKVVSNQATTHSDALNDYQKLIKEKDAVKLFTNSKSIHTKIVACSELARMFSPKGLRGAKIENGLDNIRNKLSVVHQNTGWLPIEIDEELAVRSGGRPIQLTAANEKLKAAWSLQIAIARVTDARLVILDAADTLRGESWQGLVSLSKLFATLADDKFYALICATGAPADMPGSWNVIDLTARSDG